MVEAAIGLGGNMGDPAAAMRRALALLDAPDCRVTRASTLYETPPWGDPDQPRFVNACALLETTLAPRELLDRLLETELALGREREKTRRWGPRPIDLDLLYHGDAEIDEAGLQLPHPRMFARAFVLIPLAEIAPTAIVSGRSVAAAAAVADATGVERIGPLIESG